MQDVEVEVDESAEAPSVPAPLPLEDSGFVDFAAAGAAASGEFRCSDCGYGAVVHSVLPPCPMCGGTIWESRPPRLPD